MTALQLVRAINREDARVAGAVGRVRGPLARAVERVAEALQTGGRLVYVGAGTSGRLGALDAAECPPTFGTLPGRVVAVIAGGPRALRRAIEGAEDRRREAARALAGLRVGPRDVVCAICASGVTPFALAALEAARRRGAATLAVTCAPSSRLRALAEIVIAPRVGPEVLAGSTRMKAGLATKMVLHTLTTAAMVRLGKVYGNLMVDLRPASAKLRARAVRIVAALAGLPPRRAGRLLRQAGGRPPVALVMHHLGLSRRRAEARLAAAGGDLRAVLTSEGGSAPLPNLPPRRRGRSPRWERATQSASRGARARERRRYWGTEVQRGG